LLPGDIYRLNHEVYELSQRNIHSSKYVPPDARRQRGTPTELAAQDNWLRSVMKHFPRGVRAPELRRLAFEAGYTNAQMRRSLFRVGVVRVSMGGNGASMYYLNGRAHEEPTEHRQSSDDGKILRAYRRGEISIDDALKLLRGRP